MNLYATHGSAAFLRENNVEVTELFWPDEPQTPNTLEYLSARKFDLVINIPKHTGEEELANDYVIRRKAADFGIPLVTNIQLAQRLVEALSAKNIAELQIKSWQEYGVEERAPVQPESQTTELRPAA